MKENLVMFVSDVEPVKNKRITRGWYLIWILSAILYGILVIHPDWLVVPPFVHIKTSM